MTDDAKSDRITRLMDELEELPFEEREIVIAKLPEEEREAVWAAELEESDAAAPADYEDLGAGD